MNTLLLIFICIFIGSCFMLTTPTGPNATPTGPKVNATPTGPKVNATPTGPNATPTGLKANTTPTGPNATQNKLLTKVDKMTVEEVKEYAPKQGKFYKEANCWVPEGRDSCAPWFVVAGSMKCGTTSVYSYLLNHPSVLPISPDAKLNNKAILALKEIRFFNDPTYQRMVNKDEKLALNEYLDIFEKISPPDSAQAINKNKVTGEASPMYVCQKGVAKRTFYSLPYAKVLILVRDPVDRMYSEFWFRQFLSKAGSKLEIEQEKWTADMIATFQQCAQVEIARYRHCGSDEWLKNPTVSGFENVTSCMVRINSQASRNEFCETNAELCVPQTARKACMNNNVKNSIYAPQVQEWIEMFGEDQLLIVRSEDLYSNTSSVMTRISKFLNLEEFDWDVIADYAYNIVNPGTKSADNHVLVTENRGGLFIGGTNAENTHNYPELPDSIRQNLNEFFVPYNELVAQLLNSPPLW